MAVIFQCKSWVRPKRAGKSFAERQKTYYSVRSNQCVRNSDHTTRTSGDVVPLLSNPRGHADIVRDIKLATYWQRAKYKHRIVVRTVNGRSPYCGCPSRATRCLLCAAGCFSGAAVRYATRRPPYHTQHSALRRVRRRSRGGPGTLRSHCVIANGAT